MRTLLVHVLLLLVSSVFAQEVPQSTKPGPGPERAKEIRDSIRQRSRVQFTKGTPTEDEDNDDDGPAIRYRADRALLMPRMERSSIVRIGIPGWLMRLALRGSKQSFDEDKEYESSRRILKLVKSLHVAAFADNGSYRPDRLIKDYGKYVKRRKAEPVLLVRAPEGGVQVHVKMRRGKVRLISLVAYGDEGAAVIRMRTKIGEGDLRKALSLMTDAAEESAGVKIDATP